MARLVYRTGMGCMLLVLMVLPDLRAQHVTLDDTIISQGPKAIIRFLKEFEAYESDKLELRVRLIKLLGKAANKGDEEIRSQLLNTLREGYTSIATRNNITLDYWKVRAESALALGRIGDTAVTPAVVDLAFNDEDLQVRMCAVRALAMLKDPRAVPRLIDMLETTNIDRFAYELVVALGEIGDKRAFPVLLAVTQRNFNEDVQKNALLAIKKLKW